MEGRARARRRLVPALTVDAPRTYTPPAGLCESCRHVKVVETRKGSRFYLCTLSDVDPRFPKYPRIPVLRCLGYVPVVAQMDDMAQPPEVGE